MVMVVPMVWSHKPRLLQRIREIGKGQTFPVAHTAVGAQNLVIIVALTAHVGRHPPMGASSN